jgi:hypothetical protein
LGVLQAASAALLVAAAGWGLHPSGAGRERASASAASTPARPAAIAPGARSISEEEMLALFPAGSCVIAEVNGQKRLIFFDAGQAERGFEVAGATSLPVHPSSMLR